ncbi:hypothetical protein EVAR_48414_1 [Eumeta japonica]|uniref:Uncharacterized protein n=1 Tax=Eumeta variegata TaxID=151549 RepID=A0A4C1XRU8_EUMVA|nr:hypothetical protein EVAR_48414_1 [Eumeta japonica]
MIYIIGLAYKGTAVLIRTDVMHETAAHYYKSMRAIGIRVGSVDKEIRLFVAYRPPGTPLCVYSWPKDTWAPRYVQRILIPFSNEINIT